MRRTALLTSLLLLPGCTGFGVFLDNTFTLPLPGNNPNLPMTDSQNVRRVRGVEPDATPLTPEPGNVWPTAIQSEPTLEDLIKNQASGTGSGEPNVTIPGSAPSTPPRQPRPATPPASSTLDIAPPTTTNLPNVPPRPVAPTTSTPTTAAPTTPASPTTTSPTITPNPTPLTTTPPSAATPGTRAPATSAAPASPSGSATAPRPTNIPQGAIVVPNGNGTSTVIFPNGTVQTIPTPR